jgi:hypothetical protein
MSENFDLLPGIEVPLDALATSVARMWEDTAARGGVAPASEDAKAMQVNFVLHLGFKTTPEDGVAQFRTVLRFSERYPSRVVVLCPMHEDRGRTEMRAKVYGECFLGKSKDDTRCVEFVLLNYPMAARARLEDQVSVCLSTDLPLYYWAHRFSESSRLADYRYLLTRAKRVLVDSGTSPADCLTYPWPNPGALRDLVYSRLLPVRQTVGQFLARYEPAVLVAGLQRVTIEHAPSLGAEACISIGWLRRRLAACGAHVDTIRFDNEIVAERSLGIRFAYADEAKYFRWRGDLTTKHAAFDANFGSGRATLPAPVSLLTPEAALGEAMFF